MRFLTLTLHPAVDRIVDIERLRPGALLDGRLRAIVPAGKGVNTARSLRGLAGPRARIEAAAWLGRGEVAFAALALRAEKIALRACPREALTRVCTTYLERDGRETHIKERMVPPTRAEAAALVRFAARLPLVGACMAVCGSAPPGTDAKTLRAVLQALRARAGWLMADTNGAFLEAAARAGLDGLKGNAKEIGAWLKLRSAFDPARAADVKRLRAAMRQRGGPRCVLVTLGAAGAALASRDRLWTAKPPALGGRKPASATGCGDAATAGWLWAVAHGEDPAGALAWAVACGTAKLASADPGGLDGRLARRLREKVRCL
ncbi:MAG: PfkB family carbohydrate kinase [Planctomycetota bacterium]|nr:PfkB family carbohydrate kinase [Planctomycetota bacterium]